MPYPVLTVAPASALKLLVCDRFGIGKVLWSIFRSEFYTVTQTAGLPKSCTLVEIAYSNLKVLKLEKKDKWRNIVDSHKVLSKL